MIMDDVMPEYTTIGKTCSAVMYYLKHHAVPCLSCLLNHSRGML